MYTVIIPTAGSGSRMNLGYNKAFYKVDDKTIIEYTVDLFLDDANCGEIILVVAKTDEAKMIQLFSHVTKLKIVQGGIDRQTSVKNGLLTATYTHVLIHDGARPLLPKHLIKQCYEKAKLGHVGLLATSIKDTIKRIHNHQNQILVENTVDRLTLMSAQTPQFGPKNVFVNAHEAAAQAGFRATDDVHLVEVFTDELVHIIPSSNLNAKFTTQDDIAFFKYLMAKK